MAFEDGYNRRVTIQRRTAGTADTWADVDEDVEVRIASMKLAEIQAVSETLDRRASHNLVAPVDADIQEGDRLAVSAVRTTGGTWTAVTDDDVYEVVLAEQAEGGILGPHHVRGLVSRMAPTG